MNGVGVSRVGAAVSTDQLSNERIIPGPNPNVKRNIIGQLRLYKAQANIQHMLPRWLVYCNVRSVNKKGL